ncbi:integrase [Sporomusaceae bacterium BoRhaA]|uniref:tyrosine-type recombinase/integrase n=1 Tax=Pelorhabdus rhamnosifermentans TaxID=2772457 RepID=UPI001C05F51A|nr:tyrosine-type recombinase/integrase [Pelorhabdus rhamnosifermentans]MBU2703174.1 integrase [Pelorhabdus rhamnosifermentans]
MASYGSVQKTGIHSWKLTVSGGFDGGGKRIRHTKTVHVTSDSPDKQEQEARKQLALFQQDIEKGESSNSGKMTLSQFYDYWKENYALKNHEIKTLAYNENLFTRIKQALGKKRIDQIEPRHIQAFLKNMAEPGISKTKDRLSSNTIRKHFSLLHSLFAKAVQWNMLPYNPVERVDPPKVEHKVKQVYTQEELGNFLLAIENEDLKYQLMVHLAFSGGLRREEIFGLKWECVNFEENTLKIESASVYTPKSGIKLKGTKNKASNADISIPPYVTDLLRHQQVKQKEKKLLIGDKWHESGLVFTTWNGTPAHPDSFYTWIKRFTIREGLPSISPHMFRHMTATYLIASGTDVRTVSGKLRHAQTSTTMNIYAHLLKSAEKETANTLGDFVQQATEKAKQAQKKQAK